MYNPKPFLYVGINMLITPKAWFSGKKTGLRSERTWVRAPRAFGGK